MNPWIKLNNKLYNLKDLAIFIKNKDYRNPDFKKLIELVYRHFDDMIFNEKGVLDLDE